MGHAIDEKPFPRSMLIAAAALISFTLLAAGIAHVTGMGASHAVPSEVTQSRMLKFKKLPDGAVEVYAAETGAQLAVLPAHKFGFVGVVLQGNARERLRAGVDVDAPMRLNQLADGRATLEDPLTGRTVLLGSFGSDNLYAFSQLFDKDKGAPSP